MKKKAIYILIFFILILGSILIVNSFVKNIQIRNSEMIRKEETTKSILKENSVEYIEEKSIRQVIPPKEKDTIEVLEDKKETITNEEKTENKILLSKTDNTEEISEIENKQIEKKEEKQEKEEAQNIPVIYNIKYDLKGGIVEDLVETYTKETDSFILKIPTRIGYVFLGWTTPEDKIPNKETKIRKGTTGNLEFEANWEVITYNIRYELYGGNLKNKLINYTVEGEGFNLENPTKRGYDFLGWTTPENKIPNKEMKINKGTIGDLEFEANWEAITYNVKYHLDNGILNNELLDYTIEGEGFKLDNPIKNGYDFVGWTTPINNKPNTMLKVNKGTIGDLEFIANWKPIVYTISYSLNGGNLTNRVNNYTIETETFTIATPTRDGYDFLGWTGSNGASANKTVTIKKGSTGNLEFTANWKPTVYTISYSLNGGNLNNRVNNYTIETETFAIATPTRDGYDFLGWTGSNGATANKTVTIKKGSIGNLTFTANWKPIVYTIGYSLNGGNMNNRVNSYTIETETFTIATPLKSGYDFSGWTGSNGTTANKTVSIKKGSTGNLTFTANWKPTVYTISYSLNGGNLNNKVSSYTIETENFTIGMPTKDGYDFLGWTGSNGTTVNKTVTIKKGNTGNLTFTANWKINSYIITYLNSDNSMFTTKQINFNDEIPNINYEVDGVHVFTGWTYNNNSISGIKMPSHNISVKANVREANCMLTTGQATDGDDSRIVRFQQLLAEKGLGSYWGNEGLGNCLYSNWSNYSHVMESANHLLDNAPRNSWPYLRWLQLTSETGYTIQLR